MSLSVARPRAGQRTGHRCASLGTVRLIKVFPSRPPYDTSLHALLFLVGIDDLDAVGHAHPSGGLFIAGDDESQRTGCFREWRTVFPVDQENGAVRIISIEIRERKTDGISVTSSHNDDLAKGGAAEILARRRTCAGKDFRHGDPGKLMHFIIVGIHKLDVCMVKCRKVVGIHDKIGGWRRNGQKRRCVENAGNTAKEHGEDKSHIVTVSGGSGTVQNYFPDGSVKLIY